MISMTMGPPSRSQGALFHCSLANMGHLMNIQKPKLGLSQRSGTFESSERSPQYRTESTYTYTMSTFVLSWCKKYWTCLQVSDNMSSFWEHISIHLLRLPFLQVCYGDFNILQLSGQRCLWSASYRMNKDAPPNTIGKLGPEGMD